MRRRGLLALVLLTAAVLLPRPGTAGLAAGALDVRARWELPPSPTTNLHLYDLAYLDDATLLVTEPLAGNILALDAIARQVTTWATDATYNWLPTGLDADPRGGQVIVGDRDAQSGGFLFVAPPGKKVGRFRLTQSTRVHSSEDAAVGPDGTLDL